MRMGNRKASSVSIACAMTFLVVAVLACNMPSSKTSNTFVCYQGITPGQTKKADVLALLGDPARTQQEGANEILLYPSSFTRQFNRIVLQNQVVVLLDVLIDADHALAYSTVKANYGEPGLLAYTNYLQGSMTYIFPDKGFAVIADEIKDVVFIKQCFLPLSSEEYMNTWGKDLPTENPFIK
jgi:hypothetical protein